MGVACCQGKELNKETQIDFIGGLKPAKSFTPKQS